MPKEKSTRSNLAKSGLIVGIVAVSLGYVMSGLSGCGRAGGYSPSPAISEDDSTTPSDSPSSSPSTAPSDTPSSTPSAEPSASPTTSGPKIIFLSVASPTGNMGASAAAAITSADSRCNTDVVKPNLPGSHKSSTYKAMLVSPGVRTASPVLNWVLAASADYVQSDGSTAIGTTTAQSIFSFNLTNPLGQTYNGMTHMSAWTGMNVDWTASANNCTNWTDSNSGNQGTVGYGDVVGSTSLNNSTGGCDGGYFLLCVEQ